MSAITTHVLDTSLGRPASGMHVVLERLSSRDEWTRLGQGVTDSDGRLRTLMPDAQEAEPGTHRLQFDTRGYFESRGLRAFYPTIEVMFEVVERGGHYHVPLLLSPFGYSTYRGS